MTSKSRNGVSVIIPTFERRDDVRRAVDSVLGQTRPADEIVVVDDGSTDGTEAELRRRYGERVEVFRQDNRGVSAARNEGLRRARFDLVAFLDSDDIWQPEKLAKQLPLMEDPNVVLSATNWTDSSSASSDHFSRAGLPTPETPLVESHPLRRLSRFGGHGIILPTTVCRREALRELGGFDERLPIGEDTLFFFRVGRLGSFAFHSTPLCVRGHSTGTVHLTKKSDPTYHRMQARIAIAILFEVYGRCGDEDPGVAQGIRELLAWHLTKDARLSALDGEGRRARRRALEALVLSRRRGGMRALAILVSPRVAATITRWRLRRKRG